jgi:hypothetical protein
MKRKTAKAKPRKIPAWRLAKCLELLRAQVNQLAPNRSRVSDMKRPTTEKVKGGSIGDLAHSQKSSDHNPNARGIVCALDITHDPAHGCDAGVIAEALRVSQDSRIKYVIYASRIFSATVDRWRWRPYTGSNPHTAHVHISVYDEEADWKLPKIKKARKVR